jgi:hypothetical protein
MKFKYTGDQDEITLRGVTFKKGKAVDLSGNLDLAIKVDALDYFQEVRRKSNAKNAD